MTAKHIKVEWVDGGREPQGEPNRLYPDGIDIDATGGAKGCRVDLPYPAARCGVYLVDCSLCGRHVGVTTAGRPDDPRSIKVKCGPVLQ